MKSPSILLSIVAAVTMVQTGAMAQQDLTVKFDTQFLDIFPTPTPPEWGVWSNGPSVSADNIHVSFEWSAARYTPNPDDPTTALKSFWATINGQTLRQISTDSNHHPKWSLTSATGTITTFDTTMSPSFTVTELNGTSGNGFSIKYIHGQNMYIEYGTNTIDGRTLPGSPPGVQAPIRYSDVEFTFGNGETGSNADLTNINFIEPALYLEFVSSDTHTKFSVGSKLWTSKMFPYVAAKSDPNLMISAQSNAATPSLGGGHYVANVPGASGITPGTGFFSDYPAAIKTAILGSLSTPLLTNIPGGDFPTAQQLIQGAGFNGTISPALLKLYQVSYAFKPSFTTADNGQTYTITFSGTITAVTGDYAINPSPENIKTYGSTTHPLTITVAADAVGGAAGTSFWGYLSNGNVNCSTTFCPKVTLGGGTIGSDWACYSTDFYNGGDNHPSNPSTGSQGGPNADIANGQTSQVTTDYGQTAQKVLGDFQELAMIGCFGNTKMGRGASTVSPDFSSTMIGAIPSWDVFKDKSYAYDFLSTQIPPPAHSDIGEYIWYNSQISTTTPTSTVTTSGAIYINPYDDRFPAGVAISLGTDQYATGNGGTLTVQLREVKPHIVGCPDGIIDGAALSILLANWGSSTYPCGDLDQDGSIGGADLSMLLARWGTAW